MHQARTLLHWVGGSLTRVAGTGLVIGIFVLVFGFTPADAVVLGLSSLPNWMQAGWFKLGLVIVGVGLIWASLTYNVWSRRQAVIDDLAEDLSWAIHHLLNRRVTSDNEFDTWEADLAAWYKKVSDKLANKAFFTRADQLHFDRIGIVPAMSNVMQVNAQHNHSLNILAMKFERLRDILQSAQARSSR